MLAVIVVVVAVVDCRGAISIPSFAVPTSDCVTKIAVGAAVVPRPKLWLDSARLELELVLGVVPVPGQLLAVVVDDRNSRTLEQPETFPFPTNLAASFLLLARL